MTFRSSPTVASMVSCAVLVFAFQGCVQVKPLKEVVGVVREVRTNTPIPDQRVILERRNDVHSPWQAIDSLLTDQLGAFGFTIRKKDRLAMRQESLYRIVVSNPFGGDRTTALDGYLPFYDIGFEDLRRPLDPFRSADMHYHVSMRAQNRFGHLIHRADFQPGPVPDDITWYKSYKKMKVLSDGKWEKAPKVTWKKLDAAGSASTSSSKALRERQAMYRTMFYSGWLRPKGANNRVDQFTQATEAHTREGHMMLAFNAISPFEQSLNDLPQKRFASMAMKSGIALPWLQRVGRQTRNGRRPMTHWQNFILEHHMMQQQDTLHDDFAWRYLLDGSQLDSPNEQKPTVVTVIEGGHLLQNDFFPNRNSFDLVRRTDKQQEKLIERWNDEKKTPKETLRPKAAADLAEVNAAKSTVDGLELAIKLRGTADSTRTRLQGELPKAKGTMHALVDSVLMRELRRSIDSLRSPEFYPPVHMVTISHLSYNGMTGHAPALDDGKWPASLIARKVYDIRVSDDPTYQKQWVGLFFSVPGVNRFGKEMIRGLTAPRNGRRILVDLKHSDLMTRRFFYDSVMVKGTIPPICSHCACTGMDMDLWSAFNDEYSILHAPFVRTFYPFGLNLFNEEIVIIHRNDGIIGLPLEQRVLGGYINKKLPWKFWVDSEGRHEAGVEKRMKRWDHIRALLLYLDSDPDKRALLTPAMQYTEVKMGVTGHKDQLAITTEDFVSAAPFFQNLFWILDRIKDDTDNDRDTTNDSLRYAWRHVCLGSDLDGLIDPIDIVPTAGQYPHFRERLKQFIPIFLELRMLEKPDFIGKDEPVYRSYADYFDNGFTIDNAMDQLFYNSLHDFTAKYFRKR